MSLWHTHSVFLWETQNVSLWKHTQEQMRPGHGYLESLGLLVPPATHTQDCFPAAAGECCRIGPRAMSDVFDSQMHGAYEVWGCSPPGGGEAILGV